MFRWRYIIPRLVILGCVGIACWLALNPLLRWGLVQGGQAAIGSRVEIDALRSLLSQAEVHLSKVALADPESPMRNLFEAERAELDIDMGQLLRRRLVINEARLDGLQMQTRRETSGALPGKANASHAGPTLTQRATEIGDAWLDHAADSLGKTMEDDLESVRLGRSLMERWPLEYERLETDVLDIRNRGRSLVELIKQAKENPVQSIEHYQRLVGGIDKLSRDTVEVRHQFGRLRQQMQIDRSAIEQAKRHDMQYVQQRLQIAKLDPEAVSNYLLGPEMGPRVNHLIQWLQWGRDQLPTNAESAPVSRRGWDIFLPGMNSKPTLLVRKVLLDGGGSMDGQAFSFSGSIQDLTTQPALHGKPATLEVSTNGSIDMLVRAVLDHTCEPPKDRIVIECPQLAQPHRTLGSAEKMAVLVAPATSALKIDLDLTGDQLSGVVRFHQPTVNLQATVSEKLGGQLVAKRLASATSGIKDIQAAIQLGGTISKPRWRLNSNLGTEMASGLHAAFADEVENRQQQFIARANAELDQQAASLESKLAAKQEELLEELNLENEELDFLKNQLANLNVSGFIPDKLIGGGFLKSLLRR